MRKQPLLRRIREQWRHWSRKIVGWVVYPWHVIVGSCIWVGQTISRAWGSRHMRYMIQGLPALFATIGVLVMGAAVLAQNSNEGRSNLAALYKIEVGAAYKNKDYALARTCAEKAIALDSPKSEYRYYLALALDAEKKPEHALAVAKSLAPTDSTGYPAAHLWLGDFISRNYRVTPETLRMMENHYLRAYQGAKDRDADGPEKKVAAQRLGFLLYNLRRPQEAEKYLLECVEEVPVLRYLLGTYYRDNNRPDDAKRMLESAANYFQRRVESNIDDHESRLVLIDVLIAQNKVDAALEAAKKGTTTSDNRRYAEKASAIYALMEANESKLPGGGSFERRLSFIEQGLRIQPSNAALLGRLVEFSGQKGEEGQRSKKLMEGLMANNISAPVLHFLLGSRAYADGKLDQAQYHWQQAYDKDPTFAIVANNLAWIMGQTKDADQPKLENALEMVNGAIKTAPKVAAFRGTRGLILFKLGRHKEAIPDLEIGLRDQPDSVELHEALSVAYEKVGDPVKAELQRKRSAELRAKNVKPLLPSDKPGEPSLPPLGGDAPSQMPLPVPQDPDKKEKPAPKSGN